MEKPEFTYKLLPSGTHLVRFDELREIYKYDDPDFNPTGISIREKTKEEYLERNSQYLKERHILTPKKLKIIDDARKDMELDKEFLDLVYKAKSHKRAFAMNKFGGNLSMPHYSTGAEKVFKRGQPGAKKMTLNLAFQVGTFTGGNYTQSFVRILKTVLMCQAMNIQLNIDVFDSDETGIDNHDSYVICNVAKSHEKLNMRNILASSHQEFFSTTLFNGYSAAGMPGFISGYLDQHQIVQDLGEYYDVIGGNMLVNKFNDEQQELVSKILKIGLYGNG